MSIKVCLRQTTMATASSLSSAMKSFSTSLTNFLTALSPTWESLFSNNHSTQLFALYRNVSTTQCLRFSWNAHSSHTLPGTRKPKVYPRFSEFGDVLYKRYSSPVTSLGIDFSNPAVWDMYPQIMAASPI